jgi:hypothetical protein
MDNSSATALSVSVGCALTLRNIADWHGRILSAVENYLSTTIQVADDADVDICGIQLIHSARRSAEASARVFSLAKPAAGKLLESLRRSGHLDDASTADRSFWLHEDPQ